MGEASPPPGRPGSNPYLTLRNILQQLNLLAVRARQGQDVFEHINPTTDPWDDAEATARSRSSDWGIPFEAFDPILSVARRAMRELVQVAAGNESVRFSTLDSDLAHLIERLQALACSVPEGGRVEQAAETAAAEPANDVPDGTKRLLSLYTGNIADERFQQAAAALESQGTVNDKLEALDGAMPIPPSASAAQLGRLLNVTKTAVITSAWWRQKRAGNAGQTVERRRANLADRGRLYERSPDDE